MSKFSIRFCLDSRPETAVATYLIDADWPNEAIAAATTLFRTEHPDEAAQAYVTGCSSEVEPP
jgi:hypothetical protein